MIIIFCVYVEQTHKTFTELVEEVSEPLNLITGQTFFGSNNLSRAFPVAVDQTFTTFRRKFGSFFLTEVLQLSHILRMSSANGSLEVISQYLYWVKVLALTGPLQEVDFLSLKVFFSRFASIHDDPLDHTLPWDDVFMVVCASLFIYALPKLLNIKFHQSTKHFPVAL